MNSGETGVRRSPVPTKYWKTGSFGLVLFRMVFDQVFSRRDDGHTVFCPNGKYFRSVLRSMMIGRPFFRILPLICFSIFLIIGSDRAVAADVSLAWDASLSPGITGYKVYLKDIRDTHYDREPDDLYDNESVGRNLLHRRNCL
jgi:hypothetical protein